MTSYSEFFADFGVTGAVAGVGLGSCPDDWSAALGGSYADASWKPGHLVRQFDVVNAHFTDDGPCDLISASLPKPTETAEVVPSLIGQRYGPLPDRVAFAEVAALIAARGVPIHHVRRIDDATPEQYWVSSSRVMFWVVAAPQREDQPRLGLGDLMSASTQAGLDLEARWLEPAAVAGSAVLPRSRTGTFWTKFVPKDPKMVERMKMVCFRLQKLGTDI